MEVGLTFRSATKVSVGRQKACLARVGEVCAAEARLHVLFRGNAGPSIGTDVALRKTNVYRLNDVVQEGHVFSTTRREGVVRVFGQDWVLEAKQGPFASPRPSRRSS